MTSNRHFGSLGSAQGRPGLSGSEAITVARTVRARNVRKMLVNDMKEASQAGKTFWPQPSVKTEPNWQGKVKLERQRR